MRQMYIKNKHFESMGFQSINRLSSKAVEWTLEDWSKAIAYVNTIVAKQTTDGIVLNTDRRQTITSKKRINYFLRGTWYKVYQKDYQRYVLWWRDVIEYHDNIVLA